jgi:ribosomal protein S14
MSKKERKIFKKSLTLAPKITLNNKWTAWRQLESKTRNVQMKQAHSHLLLHSFNSLDSNMPFLLDRVQERLWNYGAYLAISKPRNYCHYVGRARSTNRALFMGRHMLRKFVRFGMLPGFIKERC